MFHSLLTQYHTLGNSVQTHGPVRDHCTYKLYTTLPPPHPHSSPGRYVTLSLYLIISRYISYMAPIASSHKSFVSKASRLPLFSEYLSLASYADSYMCVPVSDVCSLQLPLPLRHNITVEKKKLLSGGTFPSFPSLSSHSFHCAPYVQFSSWNIITQLHCHTSELDPDNEFHLFLCLYHVETTPSRHHGKQQISKFRHVPGEDVASSWRGAWEVVNFNLTYRGLSCPPSHI